MKKGRIGLCIAALKLAVASTGRAAISGETPLEIDFTKPEDAQVKCVWFPADKLAVTQDGLVWAGSPVELHEGWIRTKPVPVGLSWRPPTAIVARVEIQPPVTSTTWPDGRAVTPHGGDVYVRYSPDRKHWSSWQVLQYGEPGAWRYPPRRQGTESGGPGQSGRLFGGLIRVPYVEHEEYGKYVSQYSTLNVPWADDEEALVRWILGKDPEFFAKRLPFIGWVEFLFEDDFRDGKRIASFRASIAWMVGGLHVPPRDDDARAKHRGSAWRFIAEGEAAELGSIPAPRTPATQPSHP